MTLRVVQIIPTLDQGGAEKQLALLARGLPRDTFDVHVIALTRGGPWQAPLEAAGVPVTVIGKRYKIDPRAYWRLKTHLRALRPDLVHTWIFAANCYGRQAAFAAGVKHVLAGERCVDLWKRGYEFWIDRWLARRTDRIVTNSSGVVEFYAEHGLPRQKFVVIPNGIELPEQAPACQRGELLEELQLPADARLIGAVGRLWPQKRVKDLIWAADLLKCTRDDAHLLVIGDGPHRWRLERFRDQVEIADKVHFLGHRGDLARFWPHFDCVWLGSAYEGQSNALMEAMAHGRPVVATDIPGNRDLIVSGETGFLVPLGDRAAFARQTLQILDDAALAARLGAAARERMRTEFSAEQMIRRHAELYSSL